MMSLETDGVRESSISPTFKSCISNPVYNELPIFILEPDESCVVCRSVLWNAFQLPCGHHVCQNDIDTLFSDTNTAVCRAEDCKETFSRKDVFPDACKRREVSNLKVYCSYRDLGCQTELPWKDLMKHEHSCTFRGQKCTKCGKAVLESELEYHMSNTCDFRELDCRYCSKLISLKAMEDHHASECRRFPMGCPNQCGIPDILREQMDSHLNECPRKKSLCTFSKYGCKVTGTALEMSDHMKESVSVHLDMLVKPLMHQNEEMAKHRVDLESIKTTLSDLVRQNDKIPQLVDENKRLQREIQTNKTSIQDMKKFLASNGEKVIQTGRQLEDKASVEAVDKLKHEVTVMKEAAQASNQRLTNIERSGVVAGGTGAGNRNVIQHVEKQVGHMDVRICELDLRLQLQETVNHDGVLMWKIRDYSRRKREAINGKTLSLYSQPFYTDRYGYKLCGRIYLNGDGVGKGTHLSFFLVVMRGDFDALLPWPFQLPIAMKLLDQNGTYQHVSEKFMPNATSDSFQRPKTEMNIACGVPCFVYQTKLETETYLKDDTIFLRVEVDTTNAKPLY